MITQLSSILAFSESRDKFQLEKKKQNEDSLLAPVKKNNGFLFGVADGLGSYKGAREASNFVCNFLKDNGNISHTYLRDLFKSEIITEFNRFIESLDAESNKASTTLSFCYLDDIGLSIWHVGDCRVFIKQDLKLIQLTSDHTQYQQLLDKKIYTKKELAEKNIGQNTLTNAISTFIELNNDYIFIPYDVMKEEYGDEISFFIMSDGAHHFWEQRKKFSKMTMSDIIKFGNALKRRIENKGPIDDYTLIGTTFKLAD
ncbi:protein phosphatase 2C domain-containing protein [Acinetobacter sp. AG3]|uniref:PP2C family protein-serine/threonine phosphatase n=1 Tax=unclassified Acinetobacter TaxID=196816 RepID=UPI001EEFEF4D|nr:protein phosphatase 2C domain-containing protein [Acinetobacter sp. AG3]MCG7221991.1 protein phosphatase 2C domain-containing protein [Acinetobacter sp. AG3]